jgi:hypothetical protein
VFYVEHFEKHQNIRFVPVPKWQTVEPKFVTGKSQWILSWVL